MNNMKLTRTKAESFQQTAEFNDVMYTIKELCGAPMALCISEDEIVCYGSSITHDPEKITHIPFRELGYKDLEVNKSDPDGTVYNEVQMLAFAIHDFVKREKVRQNLNWSFAFPIAQDMDGRSSKGRIWTMILRIEGREGEKSWVTYTMLAVFLGGLGIHNFYAGQKNKGLIKLLLTCTLIASPFTQIWSLYEAYQAYEMKKIPE